MEEYNQCFKELNIFQVVYEAGEAEGLRAAVKMFLAFAVISPKNPLKFYLLNFCLTYPLAFSIG